MLLYNFIRLVLSSKKNQKGIKKSSEVSISIPVDSLDSLASLTSTEELIERDNSLNINIDELLIDKSKINYNQETGAYKLFLNIKKGGEQETGRIKNIYNCCEYFCKVLKWIAFFVVLMFVIALGFYVDANLGWVGDLFMSPTSTRKTIVVVCFVLIYLMIWSCIFR